MGGFYCLAYICTKEVGVFGVGAECECQGGWAERLISYKKLPCSSRSGLKLRGQWKKMGRSCYGLLAVEAAILWILILTIHDTARDEYDPGPTNQSIVLKCMQAQTGI